MVTDPESGCVVGDGMLATAFAKIGDRVNRGLIFATGVSDSLCRDGAAYAREGELLESALARCRSQDSTLVYFSSGGAIYGDYAGHRNEDSPVAPSCEYGIRKLEFERLIRESGVDHLILRLPNVAGLGGNPANLVPGLVKQVATGRVRVYRRATRDIIAVEDVVEIVRRLLAAGRRRDLLVVATGIATPVEHLVDRISKILSVSPRVETVERESIQIFDASRLNALIEMPRFDADYPFMLLQRYVPGMARSLAGEPAVPFRFAEEPADGRS